MFKYLLKKFRPSSVERAAVLKHRLAWIYAIVGWHAFVLMFYALTKDTLSLNAADRKAAIIHQMQKDGKTITIKSIKGLKTETTVIESDQNLVPS